MKKLNIILLVMCLFSVGLFAQQSEVNMPGTDGQEHTSHNKRPALLRRRR